jgi:hypothetical protein
MPLYLLVQRFSHLSLASANRPKGLEFNQFRLNHTRFALTTQWIDDFRLRCLWHEVDGQRGAVSRFDLPGNFQVVSEAQSFSSHRFPNRAGYFHSTRLSRPET